MTENPNQPRVYDVVLGGQSKAPTGGAVLGGLEAVLQRLASAVVEQRIAALSEALKYGQPGLDLVIQALKDESDQLHKAAYRLLRKRTQEPRVKQALRAYNPYRFFECLAILDEHPGSVSASVALSADGQTLVSGGSYDDDRTIKIWNLPTGQELCTLKGHSGSVRSLVLSPDGQTLVSGSPQDPIIKVWNLRTKREIRTLNDLMAVGAIAVDRDWQILVNGSYDCTVKIWDLQTGQQIRTLKGHSGSVNAVALSSDGQTVASGGGDCTLKVWNVRTGQEIYTLKGHLNSITAVAFSADGQIFSGSKGTIKVWDVRKGRELHTLNGHSDFVLAIALSPDDQTLFSAGSYYDKTIKVWNWRTGQEICTLDANPAGVSSLALSVDGQTLVSASHNIKVWGVR